MNDEDIENLLDNLFSSEHSPRLTDSFVDTFLASPAQASEESGQRVMALFVEKVLGNVFTKPVREVGEEPFGRWIQSVRRSARLSISDIGNAIGKEPSYVDRLESGRTWPWELNPKDMVNVICLFRIHIKAAALLVQQSFSLSCAQVPGNVSGRAHRGKMSKERGDSTQRALDLFLTKNAKPKELDNSVTEWLLKVQKHLEDCQAQELLD